MIEIWTSTSQILKYVMYIRYTTFRYINGEHYSKTLEAWLKKHDGNYKTIMSLFEQTYGNKADAVVWFNRWRVFYIACSELFRYGGGDEWGVGHYLFQKKP